MSNNKKQFSLTLLVRILLATLIVVSVCVFAYSVMRYNALMEEKTLLEAELIEYREMKEELQEMLASGYSKEEIIEFAKDKWGLYLPDEEILIPD